MSELKRHQDLTIESLEAICKRLDKSYGPISGLDQFKLIDDILRLIKYRDSRQESETKAQAVFLGADFTSDYLKEVGAKAVEELKGNFPSMLRKMWSAGEIMKWLDEQAQQLRDGN